MDKKLGIVVQCLFGVEVVSEFRKAYKGTKEVQTLTDSSMRSMLYQGDAIPHIPYGDLFVVKLGRPVHILAMSTRFGPVIMRVTHRREVEVLMNRAVSPYYHKKLHEIGMSTSHIYNEMTKFMGLNSDKRKYPGDKPMVNLGQMIEQDLTH